MVTTRARAAVAESWEEVVPTTHEEYAKTWEGPRSPTPPPPPSSAPGTPEDYEKLRGERIKENLERLKKLGILNLSVQLKSQLQPRVSSTSSHQHRSRRRNAPIVSNKGNKPLPLRRSARLRKEVNSEKDSSSSTEEGVRTEEGAREEIYTDVHEKALGTCEMTWILFVDGYDKDGKRIYDQVNGKSCHQCRQKTLGYRTICSQCKLTQGQFCGDCLFMRYGENVLEANKNPNWICPVCRGICNCSLCRIKKGWLPTGSLYRKVLSLGYKSVAHYLIQTRRQRTISEDLNSSQSVYAENCTEDGRQQDFDEKNSQTREVNKVNESLGDLKTITECVSIAVRATKRHKI